VFFKNILETVMQRRRFLEYSASLMAGMSINSIHSARLFAANLPADITDFSALDLSAAIQQKTVSCTEVMQAYLARIHRYNPLYNAIVSLQSDATLLAQANEADAALARGEYRGWMHGMPHAAKDLTAVKGIRFTSASPIYADRIADEDSSVAAAIRGAGAIFVGKTNASEFGLGSQSYNPVFGATGSACDPTLTAGGSSGGAGSALGTCMVPVADGSDMMGSLRNPGAFNNVIGFRPSTSVMSNGTSAERSLSTSGPMGRNTADTIRLLQTIAQQPIEAVTGPAKLSDLKIGWLGSFDNYLAMEPGVIDLCEAALSNLSSEGVVVEAVAPRFDMADVWLCWNTLRNASRASYLQFYNDPAMRPLLKPELIWEIEQGIALTPHDIERANSIRGNWYLELDRLFETYDLLALPTSQVFPFPKTIHWPDSINGTAMDTYHRWMEVVIASSVGGIPTVNVPVGFDAAGRPMGMQLMGRFGQDHKVLEFALAYEQVTDFLQRRVPLG
jgi:amidase